MQYQILHAISNTAIAISNTAIAISNTAMQHLMRVRVKVRVRVGVRVRVRFRVRVRVRFRVRVRVATKNSEKKSAEIGRATVCNYGPSASNIAIRTAQRYYYTFLILQCSI